MRCKSIKKGVCTQIRNPQRLVACHSRAVGFSLICALGKGSIMRKEGQKEKSTKIEIYSRDVTASVSKDSRYLLPFPLHDLLIQYRL